MIGGWFDRFTVTSVDCLKFKWRLDFKLNVHHLWVFNASTSSYKIRQRLVGKKPFQVRHANRVMELCRVLALLIEMEYVFDKWKNVDVLIPASAIAISGDVHTLPFPSRANGNWSWRSRDVAVTAHKCISLTGPCPDISIYTHRHTDTDTHRFNNDCWSNSTIDGGQSWIATVS